MFIRSSILLLSLVLMACLYQAAQGAASPGTGPAAAAPKTASGTGPAATAPKASPGTGPAAAAPKTASGTGPAAAAPKTPTGTGPASGTPSATALSATISASLKNPVRLNTNVKLTCKATGGTAPYTYSWTEVGEAGVKSTKATYTTKSDDKDTDKFKCSVTDSAKPAVTAESKEYKVVFSGASGLPLTFAVTICLPLLAALTSTVTRD